MQTQIKTIGIVHSCFKEKFGIPRQPGLTSAATAVLELTGEYATMDAVRGLDQCSHVWVLFLFSEHLGRDWTPLVRPPRSAGGKMGVFATRSTFRPNPIGMSAVKLERVENKSAKPLLHLSGIDILDGTPVIDIKPYLPYSDALPGAHNRYAPTHQLLSLPLQFSEQAQRQLSQQSNAEKLRELIEQVLLNDPRPTHHRRKTAGSKAVDPKTAHPQAIHLKSMNTETMNGKIEDRSYGTLLHNVNVRWKITDKTVEVLSIETIK